MRSAVHRRCPSLEHGKPPAAQNTMSPVYIPPSCDEDRVLPAFVEVRGTFGTKLMATLT
jgi:hypothetical protein